MSESALMDDGWVRDPEAIDTIVRLGELRAGDQVELQGCENFCLTSKFEDGEIVTLRTLEDSADWFGKPANLSRGAWRYECVVGQIDTHGTWVICQKNIAAWRRPHGS